MDNAVNIFKVGIEQFLKDMIGEHQFEYENSSLRFSREIGRENFILVVYVCNQHQYVALTNVLLPPSMLKRGVSIEILNLLVSICNKVSYNCYITEIVGEGWKQALVRHGGVEDEDGDVIIDKQKWVEKNVPKLLRFVEVEDALILESEAEQYRQARQKCIVEVQRVFASWGTNLDIARQKGYIEQIIADKGEETYYVTINYNNIKYINELIGKGQFESHIKKHGGIGSWF